MEKKYWNEKMENMPYEEMRELQLEKLKRQIKYCYDNSPLYYKPKFDEAGIKPEDIKTWDDFANMPLMGSKEMERRSQEESREKEGHPFGTFLCAPKEKVTGVTATGGTTGRSKAAIWETLTWDTFVTLFNCVAATPQRPVHLCVAPISHTAGPMAVALMAVGGKTVVLPGFDALEVMKNIEQHKVTHIFLPPTALYAMLAHPEVGNFDYSSLKYFIVAAAPVAPEKIREAIKVFGPCLCQAYGQSEAPAVLTWMAPEHFAAACADATREHRLKSCGQPTLGTRIAIMDDTGRILPAGEAGEIVVRSNLATPGYLDNPEATAEIKKFGWHHTGDIGIIDDDGFVYIVDRKKEMIISGGFNIYPAEVEARILTHPAIQEAAVIGIPDEKWGESVTAIVTKDPNSKVTGEEIIQYCAKKIASYKKPKYVEFVSELPRNETGKILKKVLREKYWQGRKRKANKAKQGS